MCALAQCVLNFHVLAYCFCRTSASISAYSSLHNPISMMYELEKEEKSDSETKIFPWLAKRFFIVIWDSKRKWKIFLITFQVFNIASLWNETKCGEIFLKRYCWSWKEIFSAEVLVHKLRWSIYGWKIYFCCRIKRR